MRITRIALLALLLTGCGGGGGSGEGAQARIVSSISITPASSSVAKGRTASYQARATYSDGSSADLSSGVTWTSGAPTIASISGGTTRGLAEGSTTITAVYSGVSGTANISVTAAVLESIAISPSSVTHGAGITTQFTAIGTYSDNTTENLTNTVTWVSNTPAVATIDSQSGLATGVTLGGATISATVGALSNTATLTVAAPNWYSAASGPMNGSRLTLLASGKAFLTGGRNGGSETAHERAYIYDEVADAWTSAASMVAARYRHTATLLDDGKVLVVGGYSSSGIAGAEIYDPTNDTWSAAGQLQTQRADHSATLLLDGRVLVAGGVASAGGASLISAELYDPASNSWSPAAPLVETRLSHSANLLQNGQVLVAGGFRDGGRSGTRWALSSAELFDPGTNTWSAAASMAIDHYQHAATTLADGRVLITGGNHEFSMATAEIYDPATNIWSAAAGLIMGRRRHTATLLQNGTVLIAGGGYFNSPLADAEIYDPAANIWTATPAASVPRWDHSAVSLPSGAVLVTGGGNQDSVLSSSEVYK